MDWTTLIVATIVNVCLLMAYHAMWSPTILHMKNIMYSIHRRVLKLEDDA